MAREIENLSVAAIATKRFNELLEPLLQQGLTQAQIAAKAGIPPQYLSDVKRNERPVTELIARRLGEEFNFNYRWLMGTSNAMEVAANSSSKTVASDTVWLPLFPFPIDGEPRQNVEWSGASVEVAGVAAAKIGLAKYPYVLQYGRTDVRGRLQQGDLILISQVANADAEFHIIGYRKSWFLARANADGDWIRAADGKVLPGDCPEIGHCVGVVWSALT